MNPPSVPPRQHFLNLMQRASEAKEKLVLRLEDDAEMNRHLRHNVATWKVPGQRGFGAGWLFGPWSIYRSNIIDIIYQRKPDIWWNKRELHASVAVLMRRKDVGRFAELCAKWFEAHPGRLGQDIALSSSVWDAGKRIVIHNPPLAEHRPEPSSLGHGFHPLYHTTRGIFDARWRRGGG